MPTKLRKIPVILNLILIALISLSAGCSAPAREPGVLQLRLSSDPTTLDPAFIVDVSGGAIAAKLFSGLVGFDQDAKVVPDIAESYDISPDAKTYTFHIRNGVRFTSGREVVAADFKYSFERVLSPKTKSPRTWLFDRIAGAKGFMDGKATDVTGIRAPDPATLVVELSAPFGPFLGLMAMPGAYVVPKEEVERLGDNFADHPVGTGPYVLKRWERGSALSLAANPSYFAEKPKLAGIGYRVIPEDLTAVAEFERGNLDAISIPAPTFRRYTEDPKWKGFIVSQVGMNTYYLGLNCSRPPFDNLLLRRAVAAAIDRNRILKTIYEDRGILADGPVPRVLMPEFADRPADGGDVGRLMFASLTGAGGYRHVPPYDPALARKLIAKSGLKPKFKVKIYIGNDPETLDMVTVIQQYLKDVGADASIVQLEWSAFKEAVNKGDADAFWLSWQADYPDPENFLYPVFYSGNFGSAGNRARFKDETFDRLITAAQSEPDAVKRKGLYAEAQTRAVEMSPWVFFWHKRDFVVHQPWVKGFRLYPISNTDKGLGVELTGR